MQVPAARRVLTKTDRFSLAGANGMPNLVLAAVYFAAAQLGLAMAFEATQVTVIWPPTGIALAAILLWGYRMWPGIALGALLANLMLGEPVATAMGIAFGNTLEAVAGAWLLHRVGFDTRLSRLRDVLNLVFFSAIVSTVISATIGVTSLCLGNVQPWESFAALWQIWWVGDAVGAVIVAPLLLVWSSKQYALNPRHKAEAAALLTGLLTVCTALFTTQINSAAFTYIVFPFVFWAALRFGQRGVATVIVLACATAVWATLHGFGPFTSMSVEKNLMVLQLFMGVLSVTGLLLAAAIAQSKETAEIKARLAAIVESSGDAIIGKDLQGIITFWNDAAERLFGYGTTEIIGRPIALLIPSEIQEQERQVLEQLHQGERIAHYETVRLSKDGQPIDVSITSSPIRDVHGNIVGTSKSVRDIRERKRADEILRDADRRKNEFLATLAHELRNPLAPIVGAAQLLQFPQINADRRAEAYDIIGRQAQHMSRLVDDLLDMSRILHGKIDLRKERIALEEAIHSAVETAKSLIEANRHTLTLELAQDTIWLDADPTRLSQIFVNLLNNAAKYTPHGGQISLSVEAASEAVLVKISDNGPGIPETMLDKIFNLFTQIDSSIERTHGGLGLGLALVKNLVEMHGGHIKAQNRKDGHGSEFTVCLPYAVSSAPSVVAHTDSPIASCRLRVLVVEDSASLARTTGWMLEALGHEACLAHNAQEAMVAAREFKPEVVMLDIGLPGMSGYDLCKHLRTEPYLKNSIFIAQTGWGQPEHRERTRAAGFDYHLVKPVDIPTLENLLLSLDIQQAA